jgi:acyl transferase domain-containing protein/acyl carrier protein
MNSTDRLMVETTDMPGPQGMHGVDYRTVLQRAYLELRARRAELDALKAAQAQPIAIIGCACRLPQSPGLGSYWSLLSRGRNAVRTVPYDRWDWRAFYSVDPEAPNKTYSRWGGFLDDLGHFDPTFFGMSPREARLTDPQQRLFLEVAWEALEAAGYAGARTSGARVGVFVGCSNNGYYQRIAPGLTASDHAAGVGNQNAIIANRVSFFLNLRGPSVVVDTMCSSSLVALHQACHSLRCGECSVALAGGVNVLLLPEYYVAMSRMKAHAPDGRCKPFDHRANGIVLGEGAGAVLLKRLDQALSDGDPILAVVKGSAVNHGGAANGLTAPNPLAQAELISAALAAAGVDAGDITYVEAHGTGTALGDPIEIDGLTRAYRAHTDAKQFCAIGSVKSNIGHLEPAAGIASVIKVILAMQNRQIPASLHFDKPNPLIGFEETPFRVNTELRDWEPNGRRIAGVSSFGIGGTNAHVVLEEVPRRVRTSPAGEPPRATFEDRPVHLLACSALDDRALGASLDRYLEWLGDGRDDALADLCFSANTGRAHFAERVAIVASDVAELRDKLARFRRGDTCIGLSAGRAPTRGRPRIAFLFTGQGAQYPQMGLGLYQGSSVYRRAFDRCDEILRPQLGCSLGLVLREHGADGSALQQTRFAQPALFALEYALAELWQSWGIEPDAVIGHSLGEYVAACVAGVFSLEHALKLVGHRALLMQDLAEPGAMAAVSAGEAEVRDTIAIDPSVLAIAAVNGRDQVVISGRRAAVDTALEHLRHAGIVASSLSVSHAFHSPLMEPMLAAFAAKAREIDYRQPRLRLIANVTGGVAGDEIRQPEYWCRHIVEPVRFADGLATLAALGHELALEIGPRPILTPLARKALDPGMTQCLSSLRADKRDWQHLLESLGRIYVCGAAVNWAELDRDHARRRVSLPHYPFQRQKYWIEPAAIGKSQRVSGNGDDRLLPAALDASDAVSLLHRLTRLNGLSEIDREQLDRLVDTFTEATNHKAVDSSPGCYELEWQPMELSAGLAHATRPSSWLLVADDPRTTRGLTKRLEELGEDCFTVSGGSEFKRLAARHWQVNPRQAADFVRLLDAVAGADAAPLRGALYMPDVGSGPIPFTAKSLHEAATTGLAGLLHLMQAMFARNDAVKPRLWVLTRDAVPAGATPSLAIAQAPLWGLGIVMSLEQPHYWGGMLDLAPFSDAQNTADREPLSRSEMERIIAEITAAREENQVAFRGDQRLVQRLVRIETLQRAQLPIAPDSSYLITGGLGALGLKVAQWLADRGARHIALVNKSFAAVAAATARETLAASGALAEVFQADVSDQEQLSRALTQIAAAMPPVRGIVHAAGVAGYDAVEAISLDKLEALLRPKLGGTWNLHELTRSRDLDFFVSFSSLSSVLGAQQLAHYAAANRFLDAFAHYRRGIGLPALTINWGPWAGGGMIAKEVQQWFGRMGIKPLDPDDATEVLTYLLGSNAVQTTVADVDWAIFRQLYEARGRRPLLECIDATAQMAEREECQVSLLADLQQAGGRQRHGLLVAYLQALVAKVLGQSPPSTVNPDQLLTRLGFDSLMSVELKNHCRNELGVDLPIETILENASIERLAGIIGNELALADVAQLEARPADSDASREEFLL